jgi:hypothetical protein
MSETGGYGQISWNLPYVEENRKTLHSTQYKLIPYKTLACMFVVTVEVK